MHVLNKDLAYHAEIMPAHEASQLVAQFFDLCCTSGCRFFTNGDFSVKRSASWTAATEATFDTGVLVVGQDRAGCLWVEDED